MQKLTDDNTVLQSQLTTAQNDATAAQAQVADLRAKQTATNDALASVPTPPQLQ
ncbi:hypothetical protein [Mesorhizobium carmichaelinearum]|uniref:hypothetical protein n=1 Tax=Mesorhizobium carmichaelinearum TaxID=1208188 RepID=UPI0015CBB591|nr:hypothetical protein [Mesorhizobium carmichaelinearum]